MGKTYKLVGLSDQWIGTPPHAWGKRHGEIRSPPGSRYTPTCVGKTLGRRLHQQDVTVHPHMRGENLAGYYPVQRDLGTPPHAWGKRVGEYWVTKLDRYTPTCVGKTTFFARSVVVNSVHPHMRGENAGIGRRLSSRTGTPPHAWGKHSSLS